MSTARQPVVYIPHGGGPWPFVDLGLDRGEVAALRAYLGSVAALPAQRPRAVLCVTAHWEEPLPTVSSSPAPGMLYDYYGFPPASYQVQWPAPGSPELAARVRQLLGLAGIQSAENPDRGYDHGTFVPLKLIWPDAQVPCVQLSLIRGLDPARHIALGRALAPLRDEGVFIIGSGMSFHNLRAMNDPRAASISATFDAWLSAAATAPPADRDRHLLSWAQAPAARLSHPREEHLIPLMVIAGAAGQDQGRSGWSGSMLGWALSAFHYGVA